MRRRLLSYSMVIILLAGGFSGIFMGMPVPRMSSQEEALLKEGKTFWDWQSPAGPLKIHYVENGSGDKHVILIHGFRSHTYTWKHLIPPLTNSNFHVWAIDLIGFGLSDKPNVPIYNQEHFIDQLAAFMEGNQIESAHLIGSSMGGGIALRTAVAHPSKVNSLTLISALGYDLKIPFYLYWLKNVDFLWGPLLSPPMIRNSLRSLIYATNKISDEQVEAYTLPYRLPGGMTASLLTMRQFDFNQLARLHKKYAKIKQPVLVIWGEQDSLIPKTHYEQFLRDFPKADRLLLSDCGHIPQEECPEKVINALIPFLEKDH